MPDGLRDQIRIAAEGNNRSMNSEIIARLEASFTNPPHGGVFGVAMSLPEELRQEAVMLAAAMEEYMRNRKTPEKD